MIVNVGDEYQGGIVAHIFNSNDNGYVKDEIHGIIVAKNDISGKYSYREAINICKNYKDNEKYGWFLPTQKQLNMIYEKRGLIGNFNESSYWCSYDDEERAPKHQAPVICFDKAQLINKTDIDNRCCVRPVRRF